MTFIQYYFRENKKKDILTPSSSERKKRSRREILLGGVASAAIIASGGLLVTQCSQNGNGGQPTQETAEGTQGVEKTTEDTTPVKAKKTEDVSQKQLYLDELAEKGIEVGVKLKEDGVYSLVDSKTHLAIDRSREGTFGERTIEYKGDVLENHGVDDYNFRISSIPGKFSSDDDLRGLEEKLTGMRGDIDSLKFKVTPQVEKVKVYEEDKLDEIKAQKPAMGESDEVKTKKPVIDKPQVDQVFYTHLNEFIPALDKVTLYKDGSWEVVDNYNSEFEEGKKTDGEYVFSRLLDTMGNYENDMYENQFDHPIIAVYGASDRETPNGTTVQDETRALHEHLSVNKEYAREVGPVNQVLTQSALAYNAQMWEVVSEEDPELLREVAERVARPQTGLETILNYAGFNFEQYRNPAQATFVPNEGFSASLSATVTGAVENYKVDGLNENMYSTNQRALDTTWRGITLDSNTVGYLDFGGQ